ncbi:phage major tail tube protein [Kingella kingae]|uniref:Phage major tail tube protein n=3 Tax=Kingella kingae TaxID=504 RepID=A0AAX2J3N1_KINKI|nr:phage major tail tube protein [Kingella kingae]SQH25202.1 phage major tail tube protein [Kingella kingae]
MPEIEIKQEDFDGLGLVGQIKLPSGVEALEGEITWNSINPEWANKAYNPFKAAQLMVRGNLQTFNAQGLKTEVPVVITVSAMFSKNALGTFKPKEKSEHPTTFQSAECRVVIDGREYLYYNAFTNTYRVNGSDALSQFRKNIGA